MYEMCYINKLPCPVLPPPRPPPACAAPHRRVSGVRRGGQGGHGGGPGAEAQPHADGVLRLQRDPPPRLPEGTPHRAEPCSPFKPTNRTRCANRKGCYYCNFFYLLIIRIII